LIGTRRSQENGCDATFAQFLAKSERESHISSDADQLRAIEPARPKSRVAASKENWKLAQPILVVEPDVVVFNTSD